MSRIVTLVLLVALAAAPASAMPVAVGRQDIARAWLRLEEELRRTPPKPADRARLGVQFDVKTRAFFRGGFDEVVRGIDSITAELRGTSAVEGPAAFAMAFRLRVEPPAWIIGETTEAALSGRPLYPVKISEEDLGKLRLRLLGPDGGTRREMPIGKADFAAPLALAPKGLTPGTCEFRIVGPDGVDEPAGRLHVLTEAPDVTRTRNEERIEALPKDLPPQALATIRARNALLVARPGALQTYAWLRDPHDLAKEIDAEIDTLAKGTNPYAGRVGDHWRVVTVKGAAVPYRIFVPEGLEGPAPLVFFLHGAGADENAFFEGYGKGIARELAAKRKFIAVAPAAVPVASRAGVFTTLLDTVIADHSIDESRVYVIGHSMGAFATGFVARAFGDRLAATCQIAGGTGRTGDDGPPVLYVLAGRDRVLSLKAPPESKLLTLRRYPDEAHTWVVPAALPGILDWLFARTKRSR